MDPLDAELARAQEERRKLEEMVPMAPSAVAFDADLYGAAGNNRFEGYVSSIPATDEEAEDDVAPLPSRQVSSITGHRIAMQDLPRDSEEESAGFRKPQKIIDREDEYRQRRLQRIISPERNDPFAMGEATPDPSVRTYADVMREQALQKQKETLLKEIAKKKEEEKGKTVTHPDNSGHVKREQCQNIYKLFLCSVS